MKQRELSIVVTFIHCLKTVVPTSKPLVVYESEPRG